MPDYRQMYLILFNAVTDAIEKLRRCDSFGVLALLTTAQQKAEELYIEAKDEE
jgi:hypothetical protein